MSDIYLEIASEDRLKRFAYQVDKLGYFEDWKGFSRVRYCGPQYMRDFIRKIYEDSKNQERKPFVAVHLRSNNTIYEGCKPVAWMTDFDKNSKKETLHCSQEELGIGTGMRAFPIHDICAVHYFPLSEVATKG